MKAKRSVNRSVTKRWMIVLATFVVAVFAVDKTPFPTVAKGVLELKRLESPYYLDENVILSAKDTLRIEGGVEVQMGAYAKLMISGAAEISGTEKEPVRFVAADSNESWNGIHFISSSVPVSVQHLIVEQAFRNTLSQSGGVFENAKFIDNYYGLWVYDSSPVVLRNCSFSRNRFALYLVSSNVESENVSIRKNVFGLFLEGKSKFSGSKVGIKENMEADVREGSVASGKERVPLSVWQRVETMF